MIGAGAANSPSPVRTDGAGGFLPGVPLGCFGVWDRDQIVSPGPSSDPAERPGRVRRYLAAPHLPSQRRAAAALFRPDNDSGCGPAMTGTAARSNRFSLRDSGMTRFPVPVSLQRVNGASDVRPISTRHAAHS